MQRTEKAVIEVIKERASHVQNIDRETILQDLMIDEVELQFALEAGIGIMLSDTDMDSIRTVGDLVDKCLAQ